MNEVRECIKAKSSMCAIRHLRDPNINLAKAVRKEPLFSTALPPLNDSNWLRRTPIGIGKFDWWPQFPQRVIFPIRCGKKSGQHWLSPAGIEMGSLSVSFLNVAAH